MHSHLYSNKENLEGISKGIFSSSLLTMIEFRPIELPDETLDSEGFSALDLAQQDCRSDIRSSRQSDPHVSSSLPEADPFLNFYASFVGIQDVDPFSWCTQSFKAPEDD
jgi:hypothetical protein